MGLEKIKDVFGIVARLDDTHFEVFSKDSLRPNHHRHFYQFFDYLLFTIFYFSFPQRLLQNSRNLNAKELRDITTLQIDWKLLKVYFKCN